MFSVAAFVFSAAGSQLRSNQINFPFCNITHLYLILPSPQAAGILSFSIPSELARSTNLVKQKGGGRNRDRRLLHQAAAKHILSSLVRANKFRARKPREKGVVLRGAYKESRRQRLAVSSKIEVKFTIGICTNTTLNTSKFKIRR